MRIVRLETFTRDPISIVRLETEEGAEGYGQISPFHADIAATVFHRQIAPIALGADLSEADVLIDRCIERNYKFPWSYICRALCGLDTAIWDLRGKVASKSVCELLGGSRDSFPVYGSSMRRDIAPEREAARLLQLREERGFRAFKVRIGSVCGHDQDQWPGRTETLVPTVRAALGEETGVLVDANSCYTPTRAIEVGRMLEDL